MKSFVSILIFSLLHFSVIAQTSFFMGYPSIDFISSQGLKVIASKNNLNIYNLSHTGGSVLSKLDLNGSIIWTKKFNNISNNMRINDFIESNDGGLLCVGTISINTGLDSSMVFKLNSNGDFIWQIKMGLNNSVNLNSIVENNQGDIVVTGSYYSSSISSNRAYIAKLNSNGKTIWGKYFYLPIYDGTKLNNSIFDYDGNILSTGYSFFVTVNSQVITHSFILKLNQLNGDTIFTRKLDSFKPSFINKIVQTKDSSIYIAGYEGYGYGAGYTFPLLIKLDKFGKHIWSRVFQDSIYATGTTQIRDMLSWSENDVLISLSNYNKIAKINSNSSISWSNAINTSNPNNLNLYSIFKTQDKQILFTGYYYNLNGNFLNVIIKTDSLANLQCYNNFKTLISYTRTNVLSSLDSLYIGSYIDTSSSIFYSSYLKLDTTNFIDPIKFNFPTICLGQSAKIYSDADSCIWPAGFTVLSKNSAKISPIQTTTYTIVGFKNGCDFTNQVTVSVIQTPINNTVSLSGKTLTTAQQGATYQWLKCNSLNAIVGATFQSYTPTTSGSYAVVTKIGSCIDTSECKSVTVAGLSYLNEESVQIYPNPIIDNINIELPVQLEDLRLRIYNLVGQVLIEDTYKNKQSISLNLESLTKGFYYLVLEDKFKKLSFKLLKD